MTATYEQIEDEAHRRFDENQCSTHTLAHYIIDVTREGWKPPEPVDPDLFAFRKWQSVAKAHEVYEPFAAYLAGARMAREQEQERAKALEEVLTGLEQTGGFFWEERAGTALAAYKAGRAAR